MKINSIINIIPALLISYSCSGMELSTDVFDFLNETQTHIDFPKNQDPNDVHLPIQLQGSKMPSSEPVLQRAIICIQEVQYKKSLAISKLQLDILNTEERRLQEQKEQQSKQIELQQEALLQIKRLQQVKLQQQEKKAREKKRKKQAKQKSTIKTKNHNVAIIQNLASKNAETTALLLKKFEAQNENGLLLILKKLCTSNNQSCLSGDCSEHSTFWFYCPDCEMFAISGIGNKQSFRQQHEQTCTKKITALQDTDDTATFNRKSLDTKKKIFKMYHVKNQQELFHRLKKLCIETNEKIITGENQLNQTSWLFCIGCKQLPVGNSRDIQELRENHQNCVYTSRSYNAIIKTKL